MIHLFLDTNIVIDFLTDRRPFAIFAERLFDFANKGRIKLYISAVSYNNTYYIVRKLTSHKETIKTLKEIQTLAETIDTSKEVVELALDSDFKDFEDAVQYYSAVSIKKLDGLVTRNVKDFKNSTISLMTPEQAIAFIESLNIS
jgi:predicted nucleic acid-binding protein